MFCVNCGTKFHALTNYCQSCGTRLVETPSNPYFNKVESESQSIAHEIEPIPAKTQPFPQIDVSEKISDAWSRVKEPGSNFRKALGWLVDAGVDSPLGHHMANRVRGEVLEKKFQPGKRPIVNFRDPSVQLGGLTKLGNGRWEVRWGKTGESARTHLFHIDKYSVNGTHAGGWKVYWSD